jgi:hypothetical protein
MRRSLLLLLLTGCFGGLSNKPLTKGGVRGQLVGSEAAGAQVFLFDHPELLVHADSAGNFSLENVPVGDYRLMALGTASALVTDVQVEPGQAFTPSDLRLTAALMLEVSVFVDGDDALSGASVSVSGTPLAVVSGADGLARPGALPPGCYTIVAQHDIQTRSTSVCQSAPGELRVTLVFDGEDNDNDGGPPLDAGPTDGGEHHDGGHDDGDGGDNSLCANVVCGNDRHCDPADGLCYACVVDNDCDSGQACVAHTCQAVLAPCMPCSHDTQCGLGGSCADLFDAGVSECAYFCLSDLDCELRYGFGFNYGYHCDADSSRCLPELTEISSCEALSGMGEACTTDLDCLNLGLVHGLCHDDGAGSHCTLGCHSDDDCPNDGNGNSWSCLQPNDGGENWCQPD